MIRVVFALIAFVVLVVVPNASWPPLLQTHGVPLFLAAPKLVLLLVACVLAWVCVLVRWRDVPMLQVLARVFFTGFNGVTTLVIASMLIVGLVGPSDMATAWFGTEERLDGALVWALMLHAAQLGFVVVAYRFVTHVQVMAFAIVGGLVAAAYLLLESVGLHPWGLVFTVEMIGTPLGAFGNVGYATIYLASMFVLGVGAVMSSTSGSRLRTLLVIALPIIAVGVGLTAGRAGVVGALVAIAAIAFSRLHRHGLRGVLAPLAAAAVLIGAMAAVAVTNDYASSRAARFGGDPVRDIDMVFRFISWQAGARAALDHPLVGSGSGALAEVIWDHVSEEQAQVIVDAIVPTRDGERLHRDGSLVLRIDDERGELGLRVINFDKAHNYFIDVAVQFGVPVLLLLVGWWFLVLRAAWRGRDEEPALLVMVVAYLVAQQAWFATPMVDPAILFVVGALMGRRYSLEAGLERAASSHTTT